MSFKIEINSNIFYIIRAWIYFNFKELKTSFIIRSKLIYEIVRSINSPKVHTQVRLGLR